MKCPEWHFVGGKGIESIAYERAQEALYLKFWNNPAPYKYLHVKAELFRELMKQEHKTTFFNKVMRPVCRQYEQIPAVYYKNCK